MASTVSTYLNFPGTTEDAFTFYAGIFGTQIIGITRMGDLPPQEGMPALTDAQKRLVINIGLPILGGYLLQGTDAVEGMGPTFRPGNNVHIMLQPDSRAEADRLFAALSAGGEVQMPMDVMFWGDYYGSFTDRYGIPWMINTSSET